MESNPGLLPEDVLLKIFSYFSYKDLVQFQFVCRRWQEISRNEHLWKDIVYKPDESDTTKDVIENLKASPELRTLDLRDMSCSRNITKELVVEIVNACPRLEQLSVCWDCLYNKFHFKMETIKILILDDNEYDTDISFFDVDFDIDDYFEHLHNYFPNVEHLDCSDLTIEPRNIYAYLRKKGGSLHALGFRCNELDSGECKLPYLSVCPHLKSLILSYLCDDIGDLSVELVENLKPISSLTLRVSSLNDSSIYLSMFRYFPNLVELELHKCSLGNEQALLFIAENCPSIEKFTLSSMLTWDENLMYVSNFKKLTFLCLKSNHAITDAVVVHLQAIMELRYLDISHCCSLTPQCLLALCSFTKLQTLKFDLQNHDPPADLCASHVQNPDLHIMFYNCKDTSVLDRLRSQRLRISLLKDFSLSGRLLFATFTVEGMTPGQFIDQFQADGC